MAANNTFEIVVIVLLVVVVGLWLWAFLRNPAMVGCGAKALAAAGAGAAAPQDAQQRHASHNLAAPVVDAFGVNTHPGPQDNGFPDATVTQEHSAMQVPSGLRPGTVGDDGVSFDSALQADVDATTAGFATFEDAPLDQAPEDWPATADGSLPAPTTADMMRPFPGQTRNQVLQKTRWAEGNHPMHTAAHVSTTHEGLIYSDKGAGKKTGAWALVDALCHTATPHVDCERLLKSGMNIPHNHPCFENSIEFQTIAQENAARMAQRGPAGMALSMINARR